MLLGAVLVLLLLGGAGRASAHAALRGSDPADGTVLKSAPGSVTLTFTESVGLLDDSFRVYDPDNRQVRIGEPGHGEAGSDTARVTLPARLGTGTYTVAWRVVSADSHPISGAFTFSVGKPSATTVPASTGAVEDPATSSLYDIARYAAYLALALLIGTVTFLAVCRPPEAGPLRGPVLTGWWTLLAATVVLLVLRAPYEEGTGPATAFDLAALERTLTSRPGLALLARLALLLVVGAVLLGLKRLPGLERLERPERLERRSGPVLAVTAALAVGLALTWAAAEHASAGIQVPVAMTSAVLHLLAMAVWLGGLTALLATLYRAAGPVPPAVVARFSRLAFAAVTVLVVTGVYQSWRGLGSWDALTGTSYGRLLIVKLAAVALLLTAAGLSRRLTARLATAKATTRERVPELVGGPSTGSSTDAADAPSADVPSAEAPSVDVPPSGGDPYRRGLRRSVLAEVAVGMAVLVITTILTGTLPGRAEAEAARSGGPTAGIPVASVTNVPFRVANAGGKVQITLDPGRVGRNSVQAVIYGPDGGLAAVPELRVSFTLLARKIGPIDARVTDKGGYWGTGSLNLPMAGTWTMNVTVRVSDLDQVTVSKPVRITR
ncbi:copper resistance CopC/CopD family protein [Streptomyces olivochromogenes]|uniref:copper resistance CopC/CopD family protein n=1 Tax=Streptomyces olivochromogenes TaxID=1963 RepID=UPI001F25FA28|nr:copper resistance protein CopC [Streptomyces olivochromogenes]MCF3136242.1 copper resistance protein CopC/CopD [Streptomyces olivochromogenes]